jgi:hypothetical protein
MWIALIQQYWRVTLFKESPENTPYSVFMLGVSALFYFLLMVSQWLLADTENRFNLGNSLLTGLGLLFSYGLYTYLLLSVYRVTNRTVQTLTCLLATHIMVHLCSWPLLLVGPWLAQVQMSPILGLLVGIIYLITTLILTVWQFMVTVHIYKHALAIEYIAAILASIGLLACNILVASFWR